MNQVGSIDCNIPGDLCQEHANRELKEQSAGFRGKITEAAMKRVSESSQRIEALMTLYDKASQLRRQSGKHTQKEDVKALVQKMQVEKPSVLVIVPGRYHHSFSDFPSSPLAILNHEDIGRWIKKTLPGFPKERKELC